MVANFHALQHVARELGLGMSPGEQALFTNTAMLSGTVQNHYVEIEQWQRDYLHVYVRAYLSQRADLGLALAPAGIRAKLGELVGFSDIHVGDERFDAAFEVHGLEAERVKRLLTPEVREALMRWHDVGARFAVDDKCVFLRLPMVPLWGTGALTKRDVHTPRELLQNLRAAMALAGELDRAVAGLPPAEALGEHVETFRDYAAANGLSFSASPLAVFGQLGGSQLYAHATVSKSRTAVELELRFDNELPEGLRVEAKGAASFMQRLRSFTAAHAETGDAAFDSEFRLVVGDGTRAERWLSQPVRECLLALQRDLGDVTLDARSVSVSTRGLPGAGAFADIFERLRDVDSSLRLAARADPQPYR